MVYTSPSQKVRIWSEAFVEREMYCPACGHTLIKSPNNRVVEDYRCSHCGEQFELKAKKNAFGRKIVDGAYRTMIERLGSSDNPNFFLLSYSPDLRSKDFFVIPKHFVTPSIIEKRKPLAPTARRAGWVGCNLLLGGLPESGKLFYIHDGKERRRREVMHDWKKTVFLKGVTKLDAKGWLLDVMRCIDAHKGKEFGLEEAYACEQNLQKLHPENKHVKDKVRQQLQILRDKGYLAFLGRGRYIQR